MTLSPMPRLGARVHVSFEPSVGGAAARLVRQPRTG
jgi:hypothetical protein